MTNQPAEGWVLWWHYSDWSSAGVYRAYTNRERAQQDLELAKTANSVMTWELTPVEMFGE